MQSRNKYATKYASLCCLIAARESAGANKLHLVILFICHLNHSNFCGSLSTSMFVFKGMHLYKIGLLPQPNLQLPLSRQILPNDDLMFFYMWLYIADIMSA